jgi:hypothetical protein
MLSDDEKIEDEEATQKLHQEIDEAFAYIRKRYTTYTIKATGYSQGDYDSYTFLYDTEKTNADQIDENLGHTKYIFTVSEYYTKHQKTYKITITTDTETTEKEETEEVG